MFKSLIFFLFLISEAGLEAENGWCNGDYVPGDDQSQYYIGGGFVDQNGVYYSKRLILSEFFCHFFKLAHSLQLNQVFRSHVNQICRTCKKEVSRADQHKEYGIHF